jgi:hypothetical protein
MQLGKCYKIELLFGAAPSVPFVFRTTMLEKDGKNSTSYDI